MKRYALHLAAALVATVAMPGIAAAADAAVTTDLNIRAGPSTEFPVVGVIPEDGQVDVHGCVRGYSWCDVTWRDQRGWVSANYLQYYYQERYVPLIEYGPTIDVPIIVFSVDSYWDHHYRHRSWYHRRAHWKDVWRHADHEHSADRRKDRREEKAENRRDRRRALIERRKEQAAQRNGRREQKAEQRKHRREQKVERRDRQKKRAVQRNRRHRDAATTERRRKRVDRSSHRSRQINRRAGRSLKGTHGFRAPRATPHRSMSRGTSHHSRPAARARRGQQHR